MCRALRQAARWIVVGVLVVGNALMVLPRSWTFMQFTRQPVMLLSPQLQVSENDRDSLILEDVSGISSGPGGSTPLPIPMLQESLRARQMRSLSLVANIDLTIQPSDASEPPITRSYRAADTLHAGSRGASGPVQFVLPGALGLPPGTYILTAQISAPPPFGDDASRAPAGFSDVIEYTRVLHAPVWPGNVALITTTTPSITIVIPASGSRE